MLLRQTVCFLKLAVLCAFLASGSLLLIPMSGDAVDGKMSIISYMIGGMFWGGLILTQVFFWMANAGKRKLQKRVQRGRNWTRNNVGIITFGANTEALVCDIACGASLVASIILFLYRAQNAWLITACLAILVFSLNLHCILNGATYRYIKAIHLEKKRTENK